MINNSYSLRRYLLKFILLMVSIGSLKFCFHYRPKRSFGQGNNFTPVCHSVHRGGNPPGPDTSPPSRDQTRPPPPRNSRLRNTVNDRPVRILLECILVIKCDQKLNIYCRSFKNWGKLWRMLGTMIVNWWCWVDREACSVQELTFTISWMTIKEEPLRTWLTHSSEYFVHLACDLRDSSVYRIEMGSAENSKNSELNVEKKLLVVKKCSANKWHVFLTLEAHYFAENLCKQWYHFPSR